MTDHTFDLLIAYENGETTDEQNLELLADLIKTGEAWALQGYVGRAANMFIKAGIISPAGEILQHVPV